MQRVTQISTLLIMATGVVVNATADERTEFFESHIRPVLVTHCYKCHAVEAKNVRGGLLLDSRKGLLAGGESGAAVVPGKPEESLLISALKHDSFQMPPDRRLPDSVVADFEKWISDGAVDPRSGGHTLERKAIDLEEGRKFWSFQPVERPIVPQAGGNWSLTDIDRLIADRLALSQLSAGREATPLEILRRLHFALVGLPPTADQIESFSDSWQANPDRAIADTTDELLASPRFGERWGRHWLDVTRFAESSGGGRSLMFPHAWRFRDYVIASFNGDKPFDQIIREHIAGDLLPFDSDAQHDDQVTGVGYLTLGPTNYEQQDKELLRMEVVDEQIDTLGRTFLGLTLGCARCHDHKFDPIPTADYYGLSGIFRSTKTLLPGNVSTYVTTALKAEETAETYRIWEKEEQTIKAEIEDLKRRLGVRGAGSLAGVTVDSLPGVVVDDKAAKFYGAWVKSVSVPAYVEEGYQHDDEKRTGRSVVFRASLPQSGKYHVRFAYSPAGNRSSGVPVVVQHDGGQSTVNVDERKRPDVDGLFHELGVFDFDSNEAAVVSVNAEDASDGVVIVDAVQFLPVAEKTPLVAPTKGELDRTKLNNRLKELTQQQKAHQKGRPEQPLAMSVQDQDSPSDWHIHLRGGIRNLGPVVARSAVSVAGQFDQNGKPVGLTISPNTSGRLELADWVASPNNPLTARVYVNRVWQHLIGQGIVRTPDNFGKMGQRPSHPKLLDYLAATFVDDDRWSTKNLIRRIVNSRVFRLESGVNTNDPDNVFLSRGIRRRLEAECLRDAVLQISGQLKFEAAGGRTITKLTQYDNGYAHSDSDFRRSVYVPFFRNSMLEFFDVFDIANSNLVTGKRSVSTLPSQSLYLLNSPFMLKQSQLAAESFLASESSDEVDLSVMIQRAYLSTLGRYPKDNEVEILVDFLGETENRRQEAWASVFQSLFASMDFRYVD